MNPSKNTPSRRSVLRAGALGLGAVTLSGFLSACAGEGSGGENIPSQGGGDGEAFTLNIDFATYNPLSLVIKEKGWLEETLKDQNVTVNWVQSAGSNKANENLRAEAIHVGSTAGSAALLARSNNSPIKVVSLYSRPEWAALVVPADSEITEVADLKGKSVAATKGTDPYFFLLQALQDAGVEPGEVTVQNLQHADGRSAMENGSVDAWSGLDPIMAGAEEKGAELFFRNLEFNTYGFLNATESFLEEQPEVAQTVVDAYEYAREWAADNVDETVKILAEVAGLDESVARKVIAERSNLDVDPVPGDAQLEVLRRVGPYLVESGDVSDQSQVDEALNTIIDASFIEKADPSTIKADA